MGAPAGLDGATVSRRIRDDDESRAEVRRTRLAIADGIWGEMRASAANALGAMSESRPAGRLKAAMTILEISMGLRIGSSDGPTRGRSGGDPP